MFEDIRDCDQYREQYRPEIELIIDIKPGKKIFCMDKVDRLVPVESCP